MPGFTTRYSVKLLVYYESYPDPQSAIQREKTLKHYVRQWKLNLIEAMNPEWHDLYEDLNK